MKVTLRFERMDVERLVTHSLEGKIWNKTDVPLDRIKELDLEIPGVSRTWNITHDGPNWILLPEHVIAALLRSVLNLQRMGMQVNIKEYICDP